MALLSSTQNPLSPSNACRKFEEKLRSVVVLAKVEGGGECREHTDESPIALGSNEGLEGPPVFRMCTGPQQPW
jgi:hypothetical protein